MDKKRAVRALGWTVCIFAGIIGAVLIVVQFSWLAIVGGLVGVWYCSYRSLDRSISKLFKKGQEDDRTEAV